MRPGQGNIVDTAELRKRCRMSHARNLFLLFFRLQVRYCFAGFADSNMGVTGKSGRGSNKLLA